ncbi:CAP domain-containing protein, partial [Linnemannia elongata]
AADADAFLVTVLKTHNSARARYGARPLQWNGFLAPRVEQYARMCKYAHSDAQSRYGENLHASIDPNTDMESAMTSWMSEASKYNYNQPGFSSATGKFTQVVWKNTTQVACGIARCPAGAIFAQPSTLIVCRYTPPGNFPGQFPQNVGRPV